MWAVINIVQLVLITVWCLFCCLSFIVVMLLTFSSRNAVRLVGWVWGPGMMLLTGTRHRVVGKEHLNLKQPSIYVANHVSFLDIPAIAQAVNTPLYFVAKKELKKMPIVGWFIWAVGMIFIDRSNREKAYASLTKAGELVRGGKDVITFPEGTRSKDATLRQFRKGSFHLAREAGVPIVPIYVHGTDRIWPTGTFRIRPGKLTVYIGEAIPPEDYEGLSLEEMAKAARERVLALQVTARG